MKSSGIIETFCCQLCKMSYLASLVWNVALAERSIVNTWNWYWATIPLSLISKHMQIIVTIFSDRVWMRIAISFFINARSRQALLLEIPMSWWWSSFQQNYWRSFLNDKNWENWWCSNYICEYIWYNAFVTSCWQTVAVYTPKTSCQTNAPVNFFIRVQQHRNGYSFFN